MHHWMGGRAWRFMSVWPKACAVRFTWISSGLKTQKVGYDQEDFVRHKYLAGEGAAHIPQAMRLVGTRSRGQAVVFEVMRYPADRCCCK